MKAIANFFCSLLRKNFIKKILLFTEKINELTLRRFEKNMRRMIHKFFKVKKVRKIKYFKNFLNVNIVDIKEISKTKFIKDTEKKYSFSRPQKFHEINDLEFCSFHFVEPFFLKNVYVIGSSNFLILDSDKAIYELYYYNRKKNFSYIDPSFVIEHEEIFKISYNSSNYKIKKAINFCGNFSYNYYHFIVEIVSKFYYLEKNFVENNFSIIFDDVVGKIKQYKEIVDYLNKNKRDIIYIKKGDRHFVEELYYLPLINIIPPEYVDNSRINYTDCIFNVESINFLKAELLKSIDKKIISEKFFIARKNASKRRNYNEEEVIKLFAKYNFDIVYPEKLSISEQISLFFNAKFIAGVTGAAFTNLIFCSEGCKALCLTSYHADLSIFSTIAKLSGVDLQYYAENEKNYIENGLHTEFSIDIEKLEKIIVDFDAGQFDCMN